MPKEQLIYKNKGENYKLINKNTRRLQDRQWKKKKKTKEIKVKQMADTGRPKKEPSENVKLRHITLMQKIMME